MGKSDVERQKEHFDSIAELYYEQRQSANHLLLKDLMWGYFFRDKKYLGTPGMSVLEPMCGYSEGRKIIERHLCPDIDYEGFDYSDTLVDIVRKNNPELKISKADITAFESGRTYDLMILIGGLHHVPAHVEKAMKTLRRALKPGGYFISLEPTHNNVIFRKIRERIYEKNRLFDDETERAFELDDLNSLFLSSGFEIVDQLYPGLLSYVMFYNPDAFPFLNVGGGGLTSFLFAVDRPFFRNFVGRTFSFATLTLLRKV